MTHTPGPWRVNPDGFIARVGGGFVPVRTPFREDAFKGEYRSDHPDEVLDANARLIAAAPEMLSALKDLLHMLEGRSIFASVAVRGAKNAIDKATGGSQQYE